MPEIIKHMDLKGKEARTVSNAITSVFNEFKKRSHVKKLEKIEIYVTKDPISVAKKILFPKLKVRRHGEIREWIAQETPSFTYWIEGTTPIIMLNANERIFKELNYNAIEGLFAHELMHLLNKLDGIEDKLDEEIDKSGEHILVILDKHKEKKPFTRDRFFASLVRITSTSVLFIKDIFANSRAMSFGFDEELYEKYKYCLYGANEIKFNEKNIINALKKDQKHVLDDVFLSYIGLNLSWVTFKMFEIKWHKYLRELARMEVPDIIEKKGDKILKEMVKLRSGHDSKQIANIIRLTQDSYYDVVKYFCGKLK